MKPTHLICALATAFSCVTDSQAQTTYQTASTPLAGSWNGQDTGSGIPTATVGMSFGNRGSGTISMHDFIGVGRASFSDGVSLTTGSYALDGGDTLALNGHIPTGWTTSIADGVTVFLNQSTIEPLPPATYATVTFALDSGEFLAGDLLVISNLVRQMENTSAVVLGSMFDAPLSGDPFILGYGSTHPSSTFGVWGYDDNGDAIYAVHDNPSVGPGLMNRAGGEVFRLNQNTSSISVKVMVGNYGPTGQDGDGITPLSSPLLPIGFSFATPVPEPSAALLMGLAAGMAVLRRRRR